MSDAISDNLGVGTSTSCHGKPAALGKPPEPADTGTCDVPNVDDFSDFLCDDFNPNEIDMVDQILSTINTGELELVQTNSVEKENMCLQPQKQVQNTNITKCSSTSMPLMALPNITNYGTITINYNVG